MRKMPGGSWLIKLSLNPALVSLVTSGAPDGAHGPADPALPGPTLALGSCFDATIKRGRQSGRRITPADMYPTLRVPPTSFAYTCLGGPVLTGETNTSRGKESSRRLTAAKIYPTLCHLGTLSAVSHLRRVSTGGDGKCAVRNRRALPRAEARYGPPGELVRVIHVDLRTVDLSIAAMQTKPTKRKPVEANKA